MTDVVTSVPDARPRRPWNATVAAALLAVMGLGGLAYAVATLAVTPGVVDRFRGATVSGSDADDLVTLLWVGAALGAVLAVILFALYVPLALGLRRGSNGSRIGVWVLCGLGFLGGGISLVTVLAQRAGPVTSGSTGQSLADAYPGGWIGLNEWLSGLQMAGYVTVAVLLIAAPRGFFGRAAREKADAGPAPYAFGPQGPAATGFPASYPVVPYRASSPHAAPGYGAQPGYAAPPSPGFGAQPGYAAQPTPGYAAQPSPPGYAAQPSPPGYAAQPSPPGYAFPADHGASAGGPWGYPPAAPSSNPQPALTGFERPFGQESRPADPESRSVAPESRPAGRDSRSAGPASRSAEPERGPADFEDQAGPEHQAAGAGPYPGSPSRGMQDPHAETAHDFWRRPDKGATSESNDTN